MSKKFILCFIGLTFALGQSLSNLTPSQLKILEEQGISLDKLKDLNLSELGAGGDIGQGVLDSTKFEETNYDLQAKESIEEALKLDVTNFYLDPSQLSGETKITSDSSSPNDSLYNKETYDRLKNIRSEYLEEKIKTIGLKKPYFGYDIFQGDPEVFQNSILESIDPDYLIGPGDEIIIMIWGDTEINKKYIVSRDGYLFIQNVGQVFVNSLTLSKLEKKLFRLLKKVYSSLDVKDGQATTFLDVSLGSLTYRPHRVFVLGEVDQPGAYNVKPSTSLFSSLYYFKGPKISGSLRSVRLIRDKKEIANIDFYDYLLSGKQINDVRLQRNDVIFIPSRGKTVQVLGEINRTKFFELKKGESLLDLIKIAGGLKSTTYLKRAQIERIIPFKELKDINVNRTIVDVKLHDIMSGNEKIDLYDGDVITFYKIKDKKQNQVTINGAVNRPGIYDILPDMKLLELIQKADSLVEDAYLDRAEIVRFDDNGFKTQIDVNVQNVLDEKIDDNIKLNTNDIVRIYSNQEMKFRTGVSISGHVFNPGSKEFYKGMTIYDLVFSGGGFENELHLKNTYLERAELFKNDLDGKLIEIVPFNLDSVLNQSGMHAELLNMGDAIKIYSKTEVLGSVENIVTISGQVKFEGTYDIGPDGRLRDLLFRAGGFLDDDFVKNIYRERIDIIRMNNEDKTKNILSYNLNDVLNKNSEINPLLEPNDKVLVYSTESFNLVKMIEIEGIVKNPGKYELKNNMTLKDLILEAGGMTEDIFRYRADISRIDPKNKNVDYFASSFSIDLNNDYSVFSPEKNENNILLKPYDIITIRPDPFFKKQIKVTIEGLVYYPGQYVLLNPKEKISDIISRAGGLRPEAFPFGSEFIRNDKKVNIDFEKIIKYPRSKENISLVENDVIRINGKPKVVSITGQVNSPGFYQFKEGKTINDYIKMAGGYTKFADKKPYVIYANGQSKRNKRLFLSPKVYDGSVIVVPEDINYEPFNLTNFATNLTALYADFTQILLIMSLASQQ